MPRTRIAADEIPGFREGAFHFHCRRRAASLKEALQSFTGGDLVVGASRATYKCPAAPIEFALLLQDQLRRDGRLAGTRLSFLAPGPEPYPLPGAASLSSLLLTLT